MTYPDDVLKAAREAAAKYWDAMQSAQPEGGYDVWAEDCRSGCADGDPEVIAACIAIMAERQRCAGIARSTEAYDDRLQQASGFLTTEQRIARAILGQQEAPHAS